jgi:hypothetical protein
LSDAEIFIAAARAAAEQMSQEGRFSVQSPPVMANQSQFLVNSIGRAIQDLQAAANSAQRTNPKAAPAIRSAIAQLAAAQTQANEVLQFASSGQLGPASHTALLSAVGHLDNAAVRSQAAARAYAGAAGTATAAGAAGAAGMPGAAMPCGCGHRASER